MTFRMHCRTPWTSKFQKVELTNRDAITASRNDLSSSLTSMGDIVSSLNNNASSNSQALINDVKAISKQINKIGQTLSGASENVNRGCRRHRGRCFR